MGCQRSSELTLKTQPSLRLPQWYKSPSVDTLSARSWLLTVHHDSLVRDSKMYLSSMALLPRSSEEERDSLTQPLPGSRTDNQSRKAANSRLCLKIPTLSPLSSPTATNKMSVPTPARLTTNSVKLSIPPRSKRTSQRCRQGRIHPYPHRHHLRRPRTRGRLMKGKERNKRRKEEQRLKKVVERLRRHFLEALAVGDAGAGLVELLLGDPHLLEGGEGSQDGATDPDGVLPLGRSDDLDLHGGRSQGGDLLLHTIGDTGVHGGAAGEDGVGVEILTDVDVALHDAVEAALVDAHHLHAQEGRTEHGLGAAEAFISDRANLTIRQFVRLLDGGRGGGGGHLLFEVEGDVAELLLDVTHDLALSGGNQRIASFRHDLHEIIGQVASGQVETQDGVGESVTLVNGDGVRHTIADIENETGGATRSVQGEHGLDADVSCGCVEGFKDDLDHLFSVSFGVERSFGVEMRRLVGGDSQLVVEGVMPDLFHVIPVGDNAVLDGIFERQNTSLGLGLVTDVGVFVAHANHDAGVARATDDRGKNGARRVITGKTGFAHARSIVDDQRRRFFVVTHLDARSLSKSNEKFL